MDEAKAIRAELKKLGYNNRKVGVKSRNYCSVEISIHDPKISVEEVEKIAKSYESISRCEASGEILCGGNTFIFVEYSKKAAEKYIEENKEQIEAIKAKAQELENHTGEEVAGVTVMKSDYQYRLFPANDTYNYVWIGSGCDYSIAHGLIKLSHIKQEEEEAA